MKRIILVTMFVITLAIASALSVITPAGQCFGCTLAAKEACIAEAEQAYDRCMVVYGPSGENVCADERYAVLKNCYLLKGCPAPYNEY